MKRVLVLLAVLAVCVSSEMAVAQAPSKSKDKTKPAAAKPAAKKPAAAKPAAAKPAAPAAAKPAAPAKAKDTAARHHAHRHHKARPHASSEEQTIELDNSEGKAVIELRNGNMYVNGDLLSTIGDVKKENHKIIINLRDERDDKEDKTTPVTEKNEYNKVAKRTVLGVYTDRIQDRDGATITVVIPNSPAEDAGLMEGDVIMKVNDRDIHDSKGLVEAIEDHNGGERVSITYERRGREFHTSAELTESVTRRVHQEYEYTVPDLHNDRHLPSPFMHSYMFNNIDYSFEYAPQMGINAEDAKSGKGVIILDVKEKSPAYNAGLRKDDMIIRMDFLRVRSVDDIQDILDETWPNQRIRVEFKRDGMKMVTYMRFTKMKFRKDM